MDAPTQAPLLSVLIPVYNEIATLDKLLARVRAVPIDKEIVVVDDGSTDGTRERLRELAAENDPRLRVFFHEHNRGKSAALRTAIAQARGRISIVQDADLEYDPAEFPKVVKPIVEGKADVVYGSRFLGAERRVLLFWHTVGNRLLTLFSNMFTNLNLTDMETCYKAFRTELLQSIPLSSERFGFEAEVTVKVSQRGCRVYEVPISYHGREYWEGKKIGWRDGVQALWLILRHSMASDDPGLTTLRRVDSLQRYNGFLWSKMRPHVSGRVLEIGSGTGGISRNLLGAKRLVVTDTRADYRDMLARMFSNYEHVAVRPLTLGEPAPELAGERFDTVVCANVLEHVEDDVAALRQIHDLLAPGGRLVLVVPMLRALYGEMDRAIHHHRRYERAEIEEKLAKAGFALEEFAALNALGIPGWWLNSVVLRRRAVPGLQARLNDWLVPWVRFEQRLGLRVGMSMLAVARRADDSVNGA
ncbi:MAG: glycosyl transferase [Proteobacteria bacterium]|nr:MAG: glycosyl transferase [Pseudomonadota bacterium]